MNAAVEPPPGAGSRAAWLVAAVRTHAAAAVAWLILTVRLLAWVLQVLTAPVGDLVEMVPDDAFYFLGIADNLAAGRGPTFDGIHPTNGYHPLWAMVLVVPAAVLGDDGLVRAALLIGATLAVGGYLALAHVTGQIVRLSPFGVAVGALLVTSPIPWERTVNGMESALVIATTGAIAVAAQRWWARPSVGRMAIVGVACGLLCLSRLSHVASVWLIPAALLWGRTREGAALRWPTQLMAWTAGTAGTAAPFILWSWARLGTVVPNSSRLKAHWQAELTGSRLSRDHLLAVSRSSAGELWRQVVAVVPVAQYAPTLVRRVTQVAVLGVVGVASLVVVRRRPRALVVIAPAVVVVLRYAIELLVLPTLLNVWYSGPVFTLAALAIAVATTAAARWLRSWSTVHPGLRGTARSLGFAAVLLVALHPAPRELDRSWPRATWEATQRIHRLPDDLQLGAFDAGQLGYFHPGLVNLDGLVREPAYAAEVTSGRPTVEVLVEQELDVLVGRFDPEDHRVPACAREIWRSSTEVVIDGTAAPVRLLSLESC